MAPGESVPARLARLESTSATMSSDLTEIKGDVKKLLAWMNGSKGAASAQASAWGWVRDIAKLAVAAFSGALAALNFIRH